MVEVSAIQAIPDVISNICTDISIPDIESNIHKPNHSDYLYFLFPDINKNHIKYKHLPDLLPLSSSGSGVEIKTSNSGRFMLRDKDLDYDYFLFYHIPANNFYIVRLKDLKKTFKSRKLENDKYAFRVSQIRKAGKMLNKNIEDIREEIKLIRYTGKIE